MRALAAIVFGAFLLAPGGAASAHEGACPDGTPLSFVLEFGYEKDTSKDVHPVPEGATFVLTDVIALGAGDADGLLMLASGERLVAVVPLVGIVSQTDLYGVHLVTGLRFEGGRPVRLQKVSSGAAWVTLVGCEIRRP